MGLEEFGVFYMSNTSQQNNTISLGLTQPDGGGQSSQLESVSVDHVHVSPALK